MRVSRLAELSRSLGLFFVNVLTTVTKNIRHHVRVCLELITRRGSTNTNINNCNLIGIRKWNRRSKLGVEEVEMFANICYLSGLGWKLITEINWQLFLSTRANRMAGSKNSASQEMWHHQNTVREQKLVGSQEKLLRRLLLWETVYLK